MFFFVMVQQRLNNTIFCVTLSGCCVKNSTFVIYIQKKSMRFLRRPGLTVALLFAYTTGMYIYFFPRNTEMSDTEKWLIVAASYVMLLVLWLVLRRRERLRREREDEMNG